MTTPFNFDNRPPWAKILLAIAAIFALTFVLLILPGCEIVRHARKSKSDSAAVKKSELQLQDTSKSGHISRQQSNTQEQWDWWKQTIIPGSRRDTNVYNFYNQPAGTAAQPVIIYEGGKGSRETNTQQTDSFWRSMALQLLSRQTDSTHNKTEAKAVDKEAETKGLGLWLIALIGLVSGMLPGLLKKAFSFTGYTIVNPFQKK